MRIGISAEFVKTSTVFGKIWANLVQKTESCLFKLKFGTKTNLNMQYSMVMFTFPVFHPKYLFWANLTQKNHSCQFKLKFGNRLSVILYLDSNRDSNYKFWPKPVSYLLHHKNINANKPTLTKSKNVNFNLLRNSTHTGLKFSQSKGFDSKIHFQDMLIF